MEVERFGSFNVDHNQLKCGIYVSRVDEAACLKLWTIDFRMRAPYKDKIIDNITLHSLEHLLASRVEEVTKSSPLMKVYVGPMGCQTGFYFVFSSDMSDSDTVTEILRILQEVTSSPTGEIPFNSTTECGNCYTLAITAGDIEAVNKELYGMYLDASRCVQNGKFDEYPYI